MNKRDLPWRRTHDPYLIWLSEVILQQTRVNQGLPYYIAFSKAYPTVKKLANAPIEEVLKLWQGLGYYSRARNLHAAANEVLLKHKGKFPSNYHDLLTLKGIGNYTAAAIASFSSNEAVAVVDGNVYRVLARYFDIETPINTWKAKKEFEELANSLLHKKQAGLHNQAIMEFGALQCVPKNPDCDSCVLCSSCLARKLKKVNELPVKAKKAAQKHRYFYYLHLEEGSTVLLQKRENKDIWHGLYEFPLIEFTKTITPEKLLSTSLFKSFVAGKYHVQSISEEYKHVLSHQIIHAVFINLKGKFKKPKPLKSVEIADVVSYPVSRLMEKYILASKAF